MSSKLATFTRIGCLLENPALVAVLVPVVLATLAGPVRAQDALLTSDPDSALAVELERIKGSPIDLADALQLALEHSTAIQEAADALTAAEQAVRREKGAFDPEIFAGIERNSVDAPTASPFAGASVLKTDETQVSGGARMTLPVGTELEVSLNTVKSETNSDFAILNPQYDTFGVISVRQPLLSGFGPSARANLSLAERTREEAQAQYNNAVVTVRSQVESLYWDLYATERFVAVLRLITRQARSLLREAELRQAAGLGSPNQVANAQTFLAQQQQSQLDGEESLDQISDGLAALLGTRPEAGYTRFHPLGSPPRAYPIVPVEDLLAEARRSNYQLIAANARVEQMRALSRAAKWDALPQLDLTGSLGGNGLAGTGQDVIFGGDTLRTAVEDGGFGDTWDQVTGRDFPTWSVGVEITVPIGLREGRGERGRLVAETHRVEQQYEAALRALDIQVRAAHRALVNSTERLQAAQSGVDATQEQVRIGLIEYRNGRSTAFELVRLGADLAEAQRRYSSALVRTAKAGAELRRLTSGMYPEQF